MTQPFPVHTQRRKCITPAHLLQNPVKHYTHYFQITSCYSSTLYFKFLIKCPNTLCCPVPSALRISYFYQFETKVTTHHKNTTSVTDDCDIHIWCYLSLNTVEVWSPAAPVISLNTCLTSFQLSCSAETWFFFFTFVSLFHLFVVTSCSWKNICCFNLHLLTSSTFVYLPACIRVKGLHIQTW